MIHINTAIKLLNSGEPLTIDVVKKNGELIRLNNAVGIDTYHRGGTFKVRLIDSKQIRQFRNVLLVAINDEEICL